LEFSGHSTYDLSRKIGSSVKVDTDSCMFSVWETRTAAASTAIPFCEIFTNFTHHLNEIQTEVSHSKGSEIPLVMKTSDLVPRDSNIETLEGSQVIGLLPRQVQAHQARHGL
jgi:hypothetical protein